MLRTLASCAIAGVLAAVFCGCGNTFDEMTGHPHTPPPPGTRVEDRVSDLSQLSSTSAMPDANSQAAQAAANVVEHPADESDAAQYLEKPGGIRHVGTEKYPGEEVLLNAKALQFASMNGFMLDHLYAAVRQQQEREEIARIRTPVEIKPTVITATLDKSGKLQELVLEQHSGKAIIDQMFLDACKKALWVNNPTREALSPGGVYQFHIEARMESFSSLDGKHWTFKTHLALAML